MNSYTKLFNNSIIFAIGNMGSRIISIILVPLYTYYLSTSEYGQVDLVTTTISMLIPVISVSMSDAVMRFIMDKEYDNKGIVTNTLIIILFTFFIFLLLSPLLIFSPVSEYRYYLIIILGLQIIERYLAQLARGLGKTKQFAFNGVLMTLVTGLSNILMLVVFNLGVGGYFNSQILALIVSILYLLVTTKYFFYIDFKLAELKTIKYLMIFAIPMIPNSILWWLINASSRYFINFYVGTSANGIFAVASRIPALLTIISQIFSQAWQLSAIEEYDEEHDKDTFYTNVFNIFSIVMFIASSTVIIIVKPFFNILFSENYYIGWQSTPFLLIGSVFSAFSSFLGATYIASKQTKGVLSTSIYGGGLSVLLNFIFIPTLGIVGAGISSMISFFVMFIIRIIDTKSMANVKINWSVFLTSVLILLVQTIILFLNFSVFIETVLGLLLLIGLILLNRSTISKIYNMLLNIVRSLLNKHQ